MACVAPKAVLLLKTVTSLCEFVSAAAAEMPKASPFTHRFPLILWWAETSGVERARKNIRVENSECMIGERRNQKKIEAAQQ